MQRVQPASLATPSVSVLLTLTAFLLLTGTLRAADPPQVLNYQTEIANALKPGQPASQRIGAAVLAGEFAATRSTTPSLWNPSAFADKIADLAANDPDAEVRKAALFALGRLNPTIDTAVPPLRAALLNADKKREGTERRAAAATLVALATTTQAMVGNQPTGPRLRQLRADVLLNGTVAEVRGDELTVNMSAGFQQTRKFKVSKDARIARTEEKNDKTTTEPITLGQLNKGENVQVVARGSPNNLQASEINAYSTFSPPEVTTDVTMNQISTGAALVPLAALAMKDKDPAIRRRGAYALRLIVSESRDNLNAIQAAESRAMMARPLFDALRQASDVLADAVTDPDTGDKDDPTPSGWPVRRLACHTIDLLESYWILLPGSRTSASSEEANLEQEEEPLPLSTAVLQAETRRDLFFDDVIKVLSGLERTMLNRQPGAGDVDVRIAAAQALEAFGLGALPATPALVQALRDPNPFVRWIAARALGRIEEARRQAKLPAVHGAEGAVQGLVNLIYNPDSRVRVNLDPDAQLAAISALASFDLASSPRDAAYAVHALGEVAAVDDFNARVAALNTLKSLWNAGVKARPSTEALSQALAAQREGFPQVQVATAELLSLYGPVATDALPALRVALSAPDPAVRRAASEAVLRITRANPK